MNLVLTNPWGLLGLLGVPALILIYYLRRRAKVVTISTVFLLKKAQRESAAGRRFDHFNNSLPFWLQLLGILLLTFILTQPRYEKNRTIQQIVIVIDSSASMQPLKATLADELRSRLPALQGDAEHASFLLLDHEPRRPRLYQGDDPEALLDSLSQWNPTDGALDPRASIRLARSLVGPSGVVVFLTDHDGPTLPFSAQRLALGEARANVGFTGVSFEKEGEVVVWNAILRNYSDAPQSRSWTLETPGRERTEPTSVTIPPRKFITLQGRIPEGQTRCLLRLDPDAFVLDDTLPMVAPKPRVARLALENAPGMKVLYDQMIRGFEHIAPAVTETDLVLTTTPEGEDPISDHALISDTAMPDGKTAFGRLLVADHALVAGLNWQSLRTGPFTTLVPVPGDTPLLWLDEKPLILLRYDAANHPQLIFTFSLAFGNALKLPAMVVLLHRFSEGIARNTTSASSLVLETSQLLATELPEKLDHEALQLTLSSLEGTSTPVALESNFRSTLRAPATPGFLSLSSQGDSLMEAAVYFADTREADLSQAAAVEPDRAPAALVETQSSDTTIWRWFALAILILALVAWYFLGSTNPQSQSA